MKKLRILVADDHALVRRGVRTVLHSRLGWRVVGEATNGREAAEKAIELKPDVAIIDLGMPELDGVEVTRQIREAVPDTKVLVAYDARVRPDGAACSGRRSSRVCLEIRSHGLPRRSRESRF